MTATSLPDGRRSLTARDVAERAGVSVATVSLVVNGKADGRVSAARQHAVRRAVAELGYRVDARARELVTGRRTTVALVLPELTSPYFGDLTTGVSSGLGGHFDLVLAIADRDNLAERANLDRILEARVEGVICHAVGAWATSALAGADENLVVLDDPGSAWHGPSVHFDLASGSAALAAHLHGLGHRTIAYLTPAPDTRTFELRRELLVERFHASPGCTVVYLHARNEIDAAADAVREAARSSILDGVTAVVCGTDDQAYGALLALDELGVDVPAAMSVAGFNDLPLSRVVRPSLTTVALPAYELGRRGAELLLEASEARRRGSARAPRGIEVATRLVPRSSTGPAPTSGGGGRPADRSCDRERRGWAPR